LTDILAFSDNPDLAAELSTIAATLGARGNGSAVILRPEPPIAGDPELAAAAIAEAAKSRGASILLLGSTKFGRMVAGRLAVMSRMPVLSDVRGLELDGSLLSGTRGVYAAKFNAVVDCPVPCIALVPQGAYDKSSGAEVSAASTAAPRVRRTGLGAPPKSALDLRSARVIVSAGRGFRRKEDLELAERLARAMGGALGASRPLSSDLGWLGEEYHIGLTGVYVRPDLYLAIGISGQLQHVAGIRDSKVIAAINKDRQAPIFQVADYGVVGDLYEVIPALLKLLGAG
jgi:electron transfer flavoprotein alpha subunit